MKKTLYWVSLISLLLAAVLLAGCSAGTGVSLPGKNTSPEDDIIVNAPVVGDSLQQKVEGVGLVTLELTYPVGPSPKVFTTGWVYGARCVIKTASGEQDISEKVRWSGSGTFTPTSGKVNHPVFNKDGSNNIILSVTVGGQELFKEYAVYTVSPNRYAYVGCQGVCPADSHGCPVCPHNVIGRIATGSPEILIKGRPAACVGDKGSHYMPCCGENTFEVSGGNPQVLIKGKPVARIGLDATRHCGGTGMVVAEDYKVLDGAAERTPTPSAKSPIPVVTGFSGPDIFQFDENNSVIGLYTFTVSVEGGTPPYTYIWKGFRAPQVLREGTDCASITVSPQEMRQPGSIGDGFFIWVTVKDSKDQYAAFKRPDGFSSNEYLYGLKFTGKFEGNKLVENTWEVITEP